MEKCLLTLRGLNRDVSGRKGFAYCLITEFVGCTVWQLAREKNSVLRQLVLPFFFLFVIAYFVYHTLHGSYGVYALANMKVQADALEADLLSLRYQREAAEHRIALFRKDTLDPDMMDERARAYLDVADPKRNRYFQ